MLHTYSNFLLFDYFLLRALVMYLRFRSWVKQLLFTPPRKSILMRLPFFDKTSRRWYFVVKSQHISPLAIEEVEFLGGASFAMGITSDDLPFIPPSYHEKQMLRN